MTVTELISTVDLSDEEMDEYVDLALSAKNVSPADKKKLKGILKHYAKMKHPFTACVRDNTKRFGKERAERICATLKDVIRGTTKWRSTERKKHLSESTLKELFQLDINDDFVTYLSELEEESMVEFADAVVWAPEKGYQSIRSKVEAALNERGEGYEYWVEDVNGKSALVCYKSNHYYVVGFSLKKGEVVLDDEENWTPVERAYVESSLSEDQLLAEMYFADGDVFEGDDGLVWKTVLREGVWKMSPGPGQRPVKKPITVVAEGKSDAVRQIISMEELAANFDAGVVEHVTVPLSHEDRVDENTGFVKAVKIEEDEEGRKVLKAGIDFTEPEIKEKALRGTIANISGGVLFDYIQKETGKLFKGVLAHAALTNHPWLNGLKPFGVEASENLTVVAFSEDNETNSANAEGGDNVTTTATETPASGESVETPAAPEFDFQAAFGMSEDEMKEQLEENKRLRAEARANRIDSQVKKWEEEGKAPALLAEAKAILTVSSDPAPVVLLSEDGKDTPLSVADVVERLVNAVPSVNLSEEQITEESTSGDKPKDDTTDENSQADLSLAEKEEVVNLVLYGSKTEAEAIAEVRAKRETA